MPLVRIGLWVLPFGRVRDLVAREPAAVQGRGEPRRTAADLQRFVADVVWAVVAISRRVPRATCLTQALVAQRLLADDGIASEIRLGVARDTTGAFEAHAWLLHEGRIVLGEVDGMGRFVPLTRTGDES